MIGFTESVSKADLRRIADAENARRSRRGSCAPDVLVYEDQGSGAFLHLDVFGEYAEPTVRESLSGGCDLVSFSGDKLLGGPQAGHHRRQESLHRPPEEAPACSRHAPGQNDACGA